MSKITPERQLTILNHLEGMSKELNTLHRCTVYVDFLEDLKYIKELVKRDIGLPMKQLYLSEYKRGCPNCGALMKEDNNEQTD